MSGWARARRGSSAAVVQKAQARSTSPVDRAACYPASKGSRRRCMRRYRSCSYHGGSASGLGRTKFTSRCDQPRRWRSKRTAAWPGMAPHGSRSAVWSCVASRVSTSRPSMREMRVPSEPWCEQRGCLPRADASSRSASTSQRVKRDARTHGGACNGESRSKLSPPPPPVGELSTGVPRTVWPGRRRPGRGPAGRRRRTPLGHARHPPPARGPPRHDTSEWSATGFGRGSRLVPGRPPGGEDLPGGNALVNQDTYPPPPLVHPKCPPPPPRDRTSPVALPCHPPRGNGAML